VSIESTGATVLVVDDSAVVRLLLARTLRADGFTVVEVAGGAEALEVCARQRPDLVLLDVEMPQMNGLEVLSVMAGDPDLAGVPVLMLTGLTSGPDVAKALELGAQDYLKKPCEPEELRARVRTALALKAKQDELSRRAEEFGAMSATDVLTGLGNRRQLEREVRVLTGMLAGSGRIAVLMLDLDHFKAINDRLGHLVGDEVLSGLASRLRKVVGERATIFRWGGEEFLVLVSSPDVVPAATLAEEIRAVVGSVPFEVSGGRLVPVTISIGVGAGTIESLSEVIGAADGALYEAKESGRNRVVVAGQ